MAQQGNTETTAETAQGVYSNMRASLLAGAQAQAARLSDGANDLVTFGQDQANAAHGAVTGSVSIENRFAFSTQKQKVRENCGTAVVAIRRTAGSGRSVVHWRTRDGTARNPSDYEARAGRVVFEKEEVEKTLEILIIDDDAMERTKQFYVEVVRVDGGVMQDFDGKDVANKIKPEDRVKHTIVILDDDYTIAPLILYSQPFQILTSIATLYALFGTDLAIIYAKKSDDDAVDIATLICIVILFLEILLTSIAKGFRYIGSIMFYMDVIACVALLPSVTFVAEAMASGLADAGGTGTIARAGRAARAGSRAGRTVKLPKLIGWVVEKAIIVGEAVASLFPKKEEEDDKDKAKDGADGANHNPRKSISFAQQMQRLEGAFDPTSDDALQDEALYAESPGEQVIAPSKIGGVLLELFTGKIIVMMMLLLVINTYIFGVPEATQKQMGLETLNQTYYAAGENFEDPHFVAALRVFAAGYEKGDAGSGHNPGEKLLYLKIAGKLVPQLNSTITHGDYTSAPYVKDEFYDDDSAYKNIRESEMQYGGPCSEILGEAIKSQTAQSCKMSAIFDNREFVFNESRGSMYLTVSIVIVLGVGMGLIAMDMQSLILAPIENVMAVVKRITDVGNDDTPDENAESKNPVLKLKYIVESMGRKFGKFLALFPKEQPMEIFEDLLVDLEAAFGTNLQGQKRALQKMNQLFSKKFASLDDIKEAFSDGSLTLAKFSTELRNVVDTSEMDVSPAMRRNPAFIMVSTVLPIGVEMVVDAAAFAGEVLAQRMDQSERKGRAINVITLSDYTEVVRRQACKYTALALKQQGEEVPNDIETYSFGHLAVLSGKVVRKRIAAELEPYGIDLPEMPKDIKLDVLAEKVDEIVSTKIVSMLSPSMRGRVMDKLDPEVRKSPSLVDLKDALAKALGEDVLQYLKSSGVEELPEDVSKLTFSEWASFGAAAASNRLSAMSPELVEISKEFLLVKRIKLIASMEPFPLEKLPERVRRLSEPESLVAHLQKVGYPDLFAFLPDDVETTFPSIEQVRDAPRQSCASIAVVLNNAQYDNILQNVLIEQIKKITPRLKELKENGAAMLDSRGKLARQDIVDFLNKIGYSDIRAGLPEELANQLPAPETLELMTGEELQQKVLLTLRTPLGKLQAAAMSVPIDTLELSSRFAQLKIPNSMSQYLTPNLGVDYLLSHLKIQGATLLATMGKDVPADYDSMEHLQAMKYVAGEMVSYVRAKTGMGGGFSALPAERPASLLSAKSLVTRARASSAALQAAAMNQVQSAMTGRLGELVKKSNIPFISSLEPAKMLEVMREMMAIAVPGGDGATGGTSESIMQKARDIAEMAKSMASKLPQPSELASMDKEALLAKLKELNFEKLRSMLPSSIELPSLESLKSMSKEDVLAQVEKLKSIDYAAIAKAGMDSMKEKANRLLQVISKIMPGSLTNLLASLPSAENLRTMSPDDVKSLLDRLGYESILAMLPDVTMPTTAEVLAAPEKLAEAFESLRASGKLQELIKSYGWTVPSAADMMKKLTSGGLDISALKAKVDAMMQSDLATKSKEQLAAMLEKMNYPQLVASLKSVVPLPDVSTLSADPAKIKELLGRLPLGPLEKLQAAMPKDIAGMMSKLPSLAELRTLSGERVQELLDKIGYPDRIKEYASMVSLPSLEEIKASPGKLATLLPSIAAVSAMSGSMGDLKARAMEMAEKLKAKMPEVASLAASDNPFAAFLRDISANPTALREKMTELLAKVQEFIEKQSPAAMAKMTEMRANMPGAVSALRQRAESMRGRVTASMPSAPFIPSGPDSPLRPPGLVRDDEPTSDVVPEAVKVPDAAEPASLPTEPEPAAAEEVAGEPEPVAAEEVAGEAAPEPEPAAAEEVAGEAAPEPEPAAAEDVAGEAAPEPEPAAAEEAAAPTEEAAATPPPAEPTAAEPLLAADEPATSPAEVAVDAPTPRDGAPGDA